MLKRRTHKCICLLLAAAFTLLLFSGCGPILEETAAEPVVSNGEPAEEFLSPSEGLGKIVISEFMVKNRATLQVDGSFPDWVELHNCADIPFCLDGWSLSDNPGTQGFPLDGITLAPGEYLLLPCGSSGTGFSLSAGDRLTLLNPAGTAIAYAVCPDGNSDVSYVLQANGTFAACLYPTPGHENTREAYAALQETLTTDSPLVINEVCTENYTTVSTLSGTYADWVELKNVSDSPVLLSDYYLSDSSDDYFLFRLPEVTLNPGRVYTVWCSGDASAHRSFAPFGLDSESDTLYLSTANGIADYTPLRDIPYRCTYGRLDGENGFFYFQKESPGKQNSYTGYRCVADAPVCLTADGIYENTDAVTVILKGSGTVRYTLDGSAPTEASPLYTAPFTVSKTTVVRAVSMPEGAIASRPATYTFILNEGLTLPVVSIATDSPSRFNATYREGNKLPQRPGNVSYYSEDLSFSMGCLVKLSGATSLKQAKKSITVKFRGSFGDGALDYDLFGTGITGLTALTLRAGQECNYAGIRDELCETLCTMATDNVLTQHYRYVNLFVNGQYYGIYALKEKINTAYVAAATGSDPHSTEVIDASAWSGDFGNEVWGYVKTHDLAQPECYETLSGLLDMESVADWFILESFCDNFDLYSGNLRYYRSPETGGKWKLIFYDLDCAFQVHQSGFRRLTGNTTGSNGQITAIISKLCKNEAFRNLVLERYTAMSGVLTDDTVLALIDRLTAEHAPDLARDLSRWGISPDRRQTQVDRLRAKISAGWRAYIDGTLCAALGLKPEELP